MTAKKRTKFGSISAIKNKEKYYRKAPMRFDNPFHNPKYLARRFLASQRTAINYALKKLFPVEKVKLPEKVFLAYSKKHWKDLETYFPESQSIYSALHTFCRSSSLAHSACRIS